MISNYKTKNFNLQEVIHTPIEAFPEELLPIAMYQMARMQAIRDAATVYFGKEVPITITSGYRSEQHNESTGGADDSFHIWRYNSDGSFICAVDTFVRNVSMQDWFNFVSDYTYGETYWHRTRNLVHIATEQRWDEAFTMS